MNKWKWVFNGVFIAAAVLIVLVLTGELRDREEAQTPQKLEGFEVFCEGEEISALYVEDGALWTGGRDGVKRIDPESGELIDYVADDLEMIYAAQICSSYDGAVWIGHNDGVTVLYEGGERVDFSEPEITGGRVNTILPLDDGVWVGTMEGAVFFVCRDGIWEPESLYTSGNGLLADPVNVIAVRKEDTQEREIWFGSYLASDPGGISIWKEGEWSYLTTDDGLDHPYINAILPLGDEVLAACGQLLAGGLSVIRESGGGYEVADHYTMEDGIPGEKVRWLYLDEAGHLWITTESDGLILSPDAQLEHPIEGVVLTEELGLSDNEIKRIVESEEYYWLAGRYGLTRIRKDSVETLLREVE